MSAIGPGFWIDPDSNKVYPVDRHERWLQDKANQQSVGLPQSTCDAIDKLDPVTHQDEIRMLGVRAGLIRVRDYNTRLSVQFYASPGRVKDRLWSVLETLPQLFTGVSHYLTIHNIYDNSSAEIETQEFKRKMKDDEPILREDKSPGAIRDIPYDAKLTEAVNKLIGPPPPLIEHAIGDLLLRNGSLYKVIRLPKARKFPDPDQIPEYVGVVWVKTRMEFCKATTLLNADDKKISPEEAAARFGYIPGS